MTLKKRASDQCSRYIRLRDALDYCKRVGINPRQFSKWMDLPIKCCTCGDIITIREAQAGHYFSRGMGGGSGAYFDERNINTQCCVCNSFEGGNIQIYTEFMLQRWGQDVIDELQILHKGGRRYGNGKLEAIRIMYKEMFNELLKGL